MHNLTCDGTSSQRGAACQPPDAAGYVDPKKCKWVGTHGHYGKNGVCLYGKYTEWRGCLADRFKVPECALPHTS